MSKYSDEEIARMTKFSLEEVQELREKAIKNEEWCMVKFAPIPEGLVAGERNLSQARLTDEEIAFVKQEINRIEANMDVFVFNDKDEGTYYSEATDRIYVCRDVFPDVEFCAKCGSTHPRDMMSVAAFLAYEYYGHRVFHRTFFHNKTTIGLIWHDECRASIAAAKTTPNLTLIEQRDLIMNAAYIAKENHHLIETDDYMKAILYGHCYDAQNIPRELTDIKFVSDNSPRKDG